MNTCNIELIQTCSACPEQYDAFLNNKKVGYLRLRHGYFRVDYPTCGEEIIYDAQPMGSGSFESSERDFYLEEAKKAILNKIKEEYEINSYK